MKNKTENINRRSFLKRIWAWIGAVALLEFGAIAFNMVSPGKNKKNRAASSFIKTVGYAEEILPGSVIPYRNGQFYLVRYEDGGFMALSLICTHLGCSVGWNSGKNQFICPCHASAFDKFGNVLNPPATRALDTYRVFIEEGFVKVDTSRKIRRNGFQSSDLVYA